MITVLFIGDVVAGMGREVVRKLLPGLRNNMMLILLLLMEKILQGVLV